MTADGTMRATRREVAIGLALTTGTLAIPSVAHAKSVQGVTAPVWAVSDAVTGQVLASQGLDEPSKIASIAKMMTALIIAELAQKQPAVLDEEVVFSQTAVTRLGTKTGLLAGERLSVREALFGLLLPSGNDAGYELARHFDARLAGVSPDVPGPGTAAFVAMMNSKATALSMTRSRFRSTFGDGGTADDRTSTPGDLLILARAAMVDPLIRQLVSTRRHETFATNAAGEKRAISWENTNKLLERSQVTGIKTGTTKSAGFCLLTEAAVDKRRYHVVVLGSRDTVSRFNDTLLVLAAASGWRSK